MDMETLAQKFDTYHAEAKTFGTSIKALGERLDTERKEREELELRISRAGFRRGDADPAAALKAAGEALRGYIKTGDESGLADLQVKAGMRVGDDAQGGYSVIPGFSSAVTARVFEISPIRQYARVVEVGTSEFEEILDLDEAAAGWVGETSVRSETDAPDIGLLRIPTREIYANPKVTQKLLDDSRLDIGAWLQDKIATKFARAEGAAFISGNGGATPRGILDYAATSVTTADATRAWGKLQYIPSGGASDFASTAPADALIDMQTAMKSAHRRNAVWVMNRATAGKVSKFKDLEGNYIWQRAMTADQPSMLLGHAVVLCDDMPDVGAGTFPVMFADLRAGYTIVDRHGLRLLRDPYSSKPHVFFYAYSRVGGDVNQFDAIKLLKIATS